MAVFPSGLPWSFSLSACYRISITISRHLIRKSLLEGWGKITMNLSAGLGAVLICVMPVHITADYIIVFSPPFHRASILVSERGVACGEPFLCSIPYTHLPINGIRKSYPRSQNYSKNIRTTSGFAISHSRRTGKTGSPDHHRLPERKMNQGNEKRE